LIYSERISMDTGGGCPPKLGEFALVTQFTQIFWKPSNI
jgi:hypothetical protein